MTITRPRIAALIAIPIGLLLTSVLILLALPLSWAKPLVENRLAARFGSPASIGMLTRETVFSFAPVVSARNVVIAQPTWAGSGSLATIGALRFRLHILPLLAGRIDADPIDVRGVRLNLVRDADGRANWRPGGNGGDATSDPGPITVDDARISYVDARQRRRFDVALRILPAGLTIDGTGEVDGAPVRLHAAGAALRARPWPFTAAIEGQALALRMRGTMARPLATQDMDFRVTARADDLKRIDRIIEAGLFGTQPVDVAAQVRRRPGLWEITGFKGVIDTSPVDGTLTAHKADGRTRLDGRIHFARLDFDDLASDAGTAKAVALEQAQGLKLVPNTRINIHKIDHTDGHIVIAADQVVGGRRPSSITSLSGDLTLDNRILTVDHLRIGLRKGAITGRATVDQHDGQPKPTVTIALDMTGSSLAALAGEETKDDVTARIDARIRLTGTGDTIREAVGTSSGTIGLAARGGAMSEKLAALVGFDLGKGLFGSHDKDQALRCAVLRLDMTDGRGRVAPLVIDTTISQSTGEGQILFPDEALELALRGAPKGKALLRLTGAVHVAGTIRDPAIVATPSLKSAKTILKAIGRALSGDTPPPASDADCDMLVARAIGAGR